MSLPLHIPGDVGQIRVAAEWLDPLLRNPILDADIELSTMVAEAHYQWTGASGDAFGDAAGAIRSANFAVPAYAMDVAEILRAYANRLDRGKSDFAGHAIWAETHGLVVAANVVKVPITWLKSAPADSDDVEKEEWDRYQSAVGAYTLLSEAVGYWWGDLEEWVAEEFGRLVADIEKLKDADSVMGTLVSTNSVVVNLALDTAAVRDKRKVAEFRDGVTKMQENATAFRANLRSGNPQLRAAAKAADPGNLSKSARALSEMVGGVSKTSKIIPGLGVVMDIVLTGKEIVDGGSESSALAGLAGSIGGGLSAGGFASVLIGAGVVVPPVGVAIGVGILAMAGSEAARYAWEAWVPLDARESIDAGIEDFLVAINPFLWLADAP